MRPRGEGTPAARRAILPALVLAAVLALPAAAATGGPATSPYVVVLVDGSDITAVTASLGIVPTFTYTSALTGFAADLTQSQVSKLKSSPYVTEIDPDTTFTGAGGRVSGAAKSTTSQVVPTGVRFIHGDLSPTAHIDGVDDRVDATVAVLDTGIDATHPDLNVVGGHSCVPGKSALEDSYGHGTGVAGVIGALDNGYGVVGVAPGARLFSVRVIDDNNNGKFSWILCGLDYVARHASSFDAVNMSIEHQVNGYNDNCGRGNPADTLHNAFCRVVADGVPVVVAAGNYGIDATYSTPGAYKEAITVSALTDFDGSYDQNYGASPSCHGGAGLTDDTFAFFSDWGSRVDFIAPGVCIFTTMPGGGYQYWSGTSFSAPHVTGAIALLKAHDHSLTPAQAQARLDATAITRSYPGDPDGIPEPTVDAGGL